MASRSRWSQLVKATGSFLITKVPIMDQRLSCATCRFIEEIKDDAFICRRYPPKLYQIDGNVHCLFPMINNKDDWWCGEYQNRITMQKGLN